MFTKSKLLAAAIGAAAAVLCSTGALAAEVKGAVYADLRYGLDYFDDSNSSNPSDLDFANHGSYWGFKASAEQGGVTAFGGYERWLDADTLIGIDIVRQAYAGVTGGWGTLQFGTFATAYMDAGRKLDPFYATAAAGVGQTSSTFFGGQSHGQSFLAADIAGGIIGGTGGFAPNQLAYTGPSIAGFSGNVAVFFDEGQGQNEQDDYAAGVEFNGMGIQAGVQYLEDNNDGSAQSNLNIGEDQEAIRIYGGFATQHFGVNVTGERIDMIGAADADFAQANAWFGILPGTRLAGSFGMENESGAEGTSFRVGVFHDVLDNLTTHLVYRNYNNTTGGADDQVISLGASFKFELSGTTTR